MEEEKAKPESPKMVISTPVAEAIPEQYQAPLSTFTNSPEALLHVPPRSPKNSPTRTTYVLPGTVMPDPMPKPNMAEIPKEVIDEVVSNSPEPKPNITPVRVNISRDDITGALFRTPVTDLSHIWDQPVFHTRRSNRSNRQTGRSSAYKSPGPASRASPATLERYRRMGPDGSQIVDMRPNISLTEGSSGSMGESATKYAPRRRIGFEKKEKTKEEAMEMLKQRRRLTEEWINAQPDPSEMENVEEMFRPEQSYWESIPNTSSANDEGQLANWPTANNPPDDTEPNTDSS